MGAVMDDPQQGRGTALAAATLALTAFLLLCAYPATGLAAWLGGKPQDVQARPWAGLKLWQAAAKSLSSEMDWRGARSWVQDQIETIASVDNQTGWHGSVDPHRPRVVVNARRRLLQSRRGRVAEAKAVTGSGQAELAAGPTAAHAQQPEPPSSRRGNAAAGGRAPGAAAAAARAPTQPTALLAVPTANVWNKTQLMLACLAMIKDKFELLVRACVRKSRSAPEFEGWWVLGPASEALRSRMQQPRRSASCYASLVATVHLWFCNRHHHIERRR